MKPARTVRLASIVALAGMATSASAQTAYTWGAPAGGLWDDSLSWSPSTGFPDLDGDTATFGLAGAYTAILDRAVDVTAITITNPDATLTLQGSFTTSIYDTISNDGQIVVNEFGAIFNTFLAFTLGATTPGTSFTIDGSGEIVLVAMGANNDAQITVAPGGVLTHASGHTIRGSGQLTGAFINNGTITSDVPASVGLAILDSLDQSGGGTLLAADADIVLSSAQIIGGTLASSGAGVIRVSTSPSTLSGGAHITGTVAIPGAGTTLEVAGPVTLDGLIHINSTAQIFNATLLFTDSTAISGSGEILMSLGGTDTGDARIQAAGGFTGVLGSGLNIHGAGRLLGELELQGVLDADSPGEILEIFDTVTVTGAGTIQATGGQLGLSSATIVNGAFDSSAGGRVRTTSGSSLLSGATTNSGTLAVMGSGHTLEIDNTLTNNGIIQINPDLTIFNATLLLSGTPSITGVGQIDMTLGGTDTGDARLEAAAGVTAMLGAGQVISGEGRLIGDFMSDARIDATSALNPLEIRGSVVQGSGGVAAATGGTLAMVNGSITGGTLESSAGGIVTAASGADNTISDLTNSGDLGVNGSGATLTASGVIVNNGRILLNHTVQIFNASLNLDDGASITGAGEINLTLGGPDLGDARIQVLAGSATIGAAQTITGSGRLTGDITMHGVIAPGASAGQINHNSGSLTLAPTSVLEIELAAADGASHDRITGNADHALSGSLVVSEIDGYIPVVGDSFVIVDGASVTGKFDSETFPSTLPNRVYRVFYEADHVLLVYTCTGDFAPPYDVLDFSDVIAFLTAFSTGDPIVDLAPPMGVFDFSDIIAFLTAFGAGCS